MLKKTITALTIAAALAATAAAGAEAPRPLLSFYPQAGTLGQDVFVANHVDLDDGPGILDFACSGDTYDGHTGQDTGIRSFREVALGVPVFAALDGRVFNIQLAVGGDLNWGATVSRFDNHIILRFVLGIESDVLVADQHQVLDQDFRSLFDSIFRVDGSVS